MSEDSRPGSGVFSMIGSVRQAFESGTRIVASLAGLGGIAYLIALGVMVIRLKESGLPSVEVVSALPRDQLLVIGIIELVFTIAVTAGLTGLAILAIGLKRPSAPAEDRSSVHRLGRPVLRWSVVAGLLCSMLIVPFSWGGLAWALALGVLLLYLVVLATPPVWQLLLVALVAALTLTLTRQVEFPSPFAGATVAIKVNGAGGGVLAAETLSGSYVGSTSGEVLIGVEDEETRRLEQLLDTRLPASLVMVPRDRIEQLVLQSASAPTEPADSIADWIGIPITCLFPKCRLGEEALQTPP